MTRRSVAIGVGLIGATCCACAPGEPRVAVRVPTAPSAPPPATSEASIAAASQVSSPEAITAPVAAGPSGKDWMNAVPPRVVAARVGDLAWAAFAVGDEVRIEPCRVRAVGPTGATLEADDHSIHENVSGALVHVVAEPSSLKIGDIVTYFDWRRDLGLGVVTRRDPTLRLDIKFRDSARVVRQEPIHVAEPLAQTVAPLAWVAFPYPPAPEPRPMYRGLVFAMDGANVFVRDDANRAWVVPLGEVKLLALSSRPRNEGEVVSAFEYGTGYRTGPIKKVFDPGYAYGVARDGDGAVRSFYFSDLVDAP